MSFAPEKGLGTTFIIVNFALSSDNNFHEIFGKLKSLKIKFQSKQVVFDHV